MIKRIIKKCLKSCLVTFKFDHVLRFINRKKISVFMYHGVVGDSWKQCEGDWLQIKESDFEKQMNYIAKHYNVIPLADIENDTFVGNKPRAIITFDDGYRNNYEIAYPILKKYNLPATIFLVGNFINTNKLFWYDKLQVLSGNQVESKHLNEYINSFKVLDPNEIDNEVNKELNELKKLPDYKCDFDEADLHKAYSNLTINQIHEMQSSGLVTFGNHTNNHDILTACSDNNDIESIITCDKILEKLNIGQNCKLFCYPNGNYSEKHIEALKNTNIEYAVKVDGGLYENNDLYQIPRISIGRNTDLNTFKLLTAGLQYGIS